MAKQINFNNERENLTEDDINQILKIITHGCRVKTLIRLRSILEYGRSTIGHFGILERLIKENGQWYYCAGQSYTDEIRTLRELILKG